MKKILVTGGLGFIGSCFVLRQIAQNNFVVNLDKTTYAANPKNLTEIENSKNYHFVKGDICDQKLIDEILEKFNIDLIVHFAAESHNDNSLKSPKPFIETNVMGTFELIQAAVKHEVRFHHVSTDEVFGDLPLEGTTKFTRDTAYNPSSPYSASKASSDHLVRAWSRSFELRATISNCSNNFGPYQHEEKLIPRMIGLIASGSKPELYGDGANVRDWIHVDDHNDGVWAVIEKGEVGQTYLLGADNQRSNLEVVRALLRIMGKPEDFISFIGDRPGHDLRYAIDASATESELGWRPKHGNFEEKLAETVGFYTKS
jgi:dTDP-glucose 4,6-dehydratase